MHILIKYHKEGESMKKGVLIFALLVVLVCLVGAATPEVKYKYKYFRVEPIYFQRTLDAAGAEGYRVVTILWMAPEFFIVMEKPYYNE